MPDIVVHNAMGDKVLERLDTEISAFIDRDVFGVAVMGPDPFIFYRFFAPHFRQGVNKRSHTMHRTKPGEFLMELAKRSQSREMFSYFAGFLCHYAMDSTSHPFIYKTADYQSDMHTAIEHRLDVLELERQGKQRRGLMDLFTQYRKLPEVREAMKSVYGWDDNCYETGYRHMKLYHWIVKDQHGVLNRLLCWFPGILSTISYQTRKADHLDLSPFDGLMTEAVEMGVKLITAAYSYRSGVISEDELRAVIGNRSYAGGEPEG